MMHVVQQMVFEAEFSRMRSNNGRVAQVLLGGPVVLAGQVAVGGFVEQIAPAHAVDLVQAGHAALRADRAVAHVGVAQHLVDGVLDVRAVGVAVDHHAGTALAASSWYSGRPAALAFRSHSAVSTAAMAVMVTGPRRQ